MVVMQQRHERKLKKLRASSAESRTESALAVFALKDQNAKLSEENTSLLERVRKLQDENDSLSQHASASSSRTQHSTDHEQPLRDQHMQLILDLSQQVSSLDEELSQARQLIRQLQAGKQT
ncbi:uncharacterized protein [Dysidea avara]|uniref:uncharacterized protein isoform X1 n=1 Tax=Dysidea avara TaxID=196820 RepID=UPI003316CF15